MLKYLKLIEKKVANGILKKKNIRKLVKQFLYLCKTV